ncbi:arylesterase [Acidiphilium sp.]|uniref:arylesterase n=1 Tax=Acidiphilium sp. TaxID=527 RepID=UPI003D07D0C6
MIKVYGRARWNGQIVFGFIGLLCVCIALALGMARANAGTPVRLLILGDSLTAGYGLPVADGFQAQLHAALRAHGADVVLVNGAVSGDTTADAAARLDWVLAGSKVDAALVELGGNDGLRGLSTVMMKHNLTRILDDLAARHIPVLLSGMIAPPSLGAAYGARFKAVFATLGHRKGVLFDPFFLQGLPGKPGLVQADGLHPNASGVRIEVKRLLPLILQLIAAAKTQH